MNTQRQTGTCRSLSGHAQRHGCEVRPSYEISTSQFSDMKVRRLTRNYGFGGYSIYRYLVSEALYKGEYFLPWCEETARAVASYWNASLEDITRIVDGCVQVGLFNDELYQEARSTDFCRHPAGLPQVMRHGLHPRGVRSFGQLIHKVIIH